MFTHTPHHDSNLDGNPLSSSCPGSGTMSTFQKYSYCATECSMKGALFLSCDGWSAGSVLDLHGIGLEHLSAATLGDIATQPTAMYVRRLRSVRCRC